jgi:hypothetical protein
MFAWFYLFGEKTADVGGVFVSEKSFRNISELNKEKKNRKRKRGKRKPTIHL